MNDVLEIERSLIKTFRKDIWSKFLKALTDYDMIRDGDNVMVCISGGKDSFLLAKCIQEAIRHGKVSFTAKYVVMNPGYNKANLDKIISNAKRLNVPIEIFNSDIFDVANLLDEKSPCYMCARMRRGALYNRAVELNCNKIALGHHFDDVIETTLLSMFYGSEVKTMVPKVHSLNFKGIELIRPLYYVKEKDIKSWCNHNNLEFINCACKFTEKVSLSNESISKRKEIKELIESLRKVNSFVDQNIFKALENINLNCVLGYKKDGLERKFLDDYNEYDEK